VFTQGFVQFASGMSDVSKVFGEDAPTQLVRVLGLAMSRIADAVISSFLVNVAPAAEREDPAGLGIGSCQCGSGNLVAFRSFCT